MQTNMTTLFIRNSNNPAIAGRCGLLLIALTCFALAPGVQAVSPPPDGGYPGGNTAEGTGALFSLTAGVWNTALGYQALYHDTTGHSNTATGLRALFSNTTGDANTANGVLALFSNTTADYNTAIGYQALLDNTIGENNTAAGAFTLNDNTTGDLNTAVGYSALSSVTTGDGNTACGQHALANVSSGQSNTALGFYAGTNVTTANDIITIGAVGANISGTCFIGNIRGTTTAVADALPVVVDSNNQLGTVSSSRRYKKDIKAMDQASEAILSLKPVTFHYKSDTKGTPQFGLIAEEVAKVNPDLIARDKNGDIYTVRYEAVNAMLLNEFLKAHSKMEEQAATITELKKGMKVLTASLKKQASQIQKVSDKVELSKPAPRTVSNR
jgi:hypothetical protein